MTKTEFIEKVRTGLGKDTTEKQARQAVETVFETLQSSLVAGDPLRLPGFGTWVVRERPARKGRNPQTGEPIRVKATRIVSWRAGETLRRQMQAPKPKKRSPKKGK